MPKFKSFEQYVADIKKIAIKSFEGEKCSKLLAFCRVMPKFKQHFSSPEHDILEQMQEVYRHLIDYSNNSADHIAISALIVSLGSITADISPIECLELLKGLVSQYESKLKLGRLTWEGVHRSDAKDEMAVLASKYEQLLRVFLFDLNKLRGRICGACNDLHSKILAKYSKQSTAIQPIPGLFPGGHVDWKDLTPHNFTILTHGTGCGTIGTPGTPEFQVCILIHFLQFDDMNPEQRVNFPQLAKLFFDSSKHGAVVTSNAAHNNAGHIRMMRVVGWRGGYSSDPYAPYFPPISAQSSVEDMEAWKTFQLETGFVWEFTRIACSITEETVEYITTTGVPSFGDTEPDDVHSASLGSNLTVSFDGFTNEPHFDNDAHKYVFGIYLFTDLDGNLITDKERIARCMNGGIFIWPDLHLGVDPTSCPGVLLYVWRGNHEQHCTVSSELLDNGVIRFGSSMQVNRHLVNRVAKAAGLGLGLSDLLNTFVPQ
ncbi:hypothetical protein BDV93DRAFT_514475 [Ceratobasidium sp. AG-I]|nr:hypothetical protein BDV93DRAFT_514475 [Ceratobasidium sp. AG-I]